MNLIRRKAFRPDGIRYLENDFFLETRFYKYNRRAVYAMALLIFSILGIFLSVALLGNGLAAKILVALVFILPVVAAFSGKTWFSFTAFDPRVLRLERNAILVGEELYLMEEIESIHCYINSFYGFRGGAYGSSFVSNHGISEYGDRNRLVFSSNGHEYQFRFALRNDKAYVVLYQLLIYWQSRGKQVTVREEFTYDNVVAPQQDNYGMA